MSSSTLTELGSRSSPAQICYEIVKIEDKIRTQLFKVYSDLESLGGILKWAAEKMKLVFLIFGDVMMVVGFLLKLPKNFGGQVKKCRKWKTILGGNTIRSYFKNSK